MPFVRVVQEGRRHKQLTAQSLMLRLGQLGMSCNSGLPASHVTAYKSEIKHARQVFLENRIERIESSEHGLIFQ